MSDFTKSSCTYSVHSMFPTIQGEGPNTGKRSVFVRFSNCNIWSGLEQDRLQDSLKGSCALICDTNFRGVDRNKGGGLFDEDYLCSLILVLANTLGTDLITFTGGEPSLQLGRSNSTLVQRLKSAGMVIEMESNGAKEVLGIDYLTISPKFPFRPYKDWNKAKRLSTCIKLLFPLYTVEQATTVLGIQDASVPIYLQPVDVDLLPDGWKGTSTRQNSNAAALEVLSSRWRHLDLRLSIQTHKYAGVQ